MSQQNVSAKCLIKMSVEENLVYAEIWWLQMMTIRHGFILKSGFRWRQPNIFLSKISIQKNMIWCTLFSFCSFCLFCTFFNFCTFCSLITMSHKNVSSKSLIECIIKMSHKNVSQKFLIKCLIIMSHQNVLSKCLIKLSHQIYNRKVSSKCLIKMCHENIQWFISKNDEHGANDPDIGQTSTEIMLRKQELKSWDLRKQNKDGSRDLNQLIKKLLQVSNRDLNQLIKELLKVCIKDLREQHKDGSRDPNQLIREQHQVCTRNLRQQLTMEQQSQIRQIWMASKLKYMHPKICAVIVVKWV